MTYTIDVHLSPADVQRQMRADALDGLQGVAKSLPPVWFYDERGSGLFEEITQLPEYYPTRTERAILDALHARLAKFKLPKRVIFADELPRNAMGKVQKNVLRDLHSALYGPEDGGQTMKDGS